MAVPNEPVDTTTRKLFNGNFSMSVKGFVQGILSNVFRKSDFATNFATSGMVFILTRYIVVRQGIGIKKCNISGKGVETK
jgi:hypothetical protein